VLLGIWAIILLAGPKWVLVSQECEFVCTKNGVATTFACYEAPLNDPTTNGMTIVYSQDCYGLLLNRLLPRYLNICFFTGDSTCQECMAGLKYCLTILLAATLVCGGVHTCCAIVVYIHAKQEEKRRKKKAEKRHTKERRKTGTKNAENVEKLYC
jgi:hypothetical protein